MKRVSIPQRDITILNMYVPNNRTSNYMKLIETIKTDRTAGRNKQIHYHSWKIQHPSLRNGQIHQSESIRT